MTASPSRTKLFVLSFRAASTISGSLGPVEAASGEQSHARAVAGYDQAIAVVLDFVQPAGTVRDFGGGAWRSQIHAALRLINRERAGGTIVSI
jgi:hypothetical protein